MRGIYKVGTDIGSAGMVLELGQRGRARQIHIGKLAYFFFEERTRFWYIEKNEIADEMRQTHMTVSFFF